MFNIFGFISSILIFLESLVPYPSYTHGLTGPVLYIDPIRAKSDSELQITNILYRKLFYFDTSGNLQKDLVSGYQISEDGLEYTISLKNNATWSDGNRIGADDILYTASNLSYFQDIGIDKTGDFSIKFTLPNKYSPLLSILTFPVASSKDPITENKLVYPTSSDFKIIKAKRTASGVSEIFLFASNPSYNIRKLNFRIYDTDTKLETALKTGEINGFYSPKKFIWEGIKEDKIPLIGRYFVLHFNLESDVFSKKETRKLAVQSIDYQNIFSQTLSLPKTKVEGPISESLYTDKSLDFYTNKPDNTPLKSETKVKILALNLPEIKNYLENIQNSWNKINLLMEVEYLPQNKIIELNTQGAKYDAVIIGEEVGQDPDRYVFWHSTQKNGVGLNFSNMSNIRVDKALEKGREELDFNKRSEHYQIFQQAIYEEAPAIFIYHPGVNLYYSSKISISRPVNIYYPFEILNNFKNWSF